MESSKNFEETKENKRRIMSVYRKRIDDATPKTQEEKENIRAGAKFIITFINPVILMFLWNWLMPTLFGLAAIGYLQSLGLYIMSRILFLKNDEPV